MLAPMPHRTPNPPPAVRSAYLVAVALLARREVSEQQLCERLRLKGLAHDTIHDAVDRLKREGALNDARFAASYARTAARAKRHGPERVLHDLARAGIPRDTARQVVEEAFAGDTDLLERAVDRRVTAARHPIDTPAQFRRLYAQLVRQGFSSETVIAALRKRAKARPDSADGDLNPQVTSDE